MTLKEQIEEALTDCYMDGWHATAPEVPLDAKYTDEILKLVAKELLEGKPESKGYKPAEDIADHWGMTDTSISRQIDNMKALGWNEGLQAFENHIRKVLEQGVDITEPEQPTTSGETERAE